MTGLNDKQLLELINSNETKKCNKCNLDKLYKSLTKQKDKHNNLWYIGICHKCVYQRKLERCSKEQLEKYVLTRKNYENFSFKGRASMLRNRALQRSKRDNLEFSLDVKLIEEKLKKGICEQTKIKLILDDSTLNPYAPSIDRINSNLGYTNDNIQITCMIYNYCKNVFSDEQVYDFFKKLKNL